MNRPPDRPERRGVRAALLVAPVVAALLLPGASARAGPQCGPFGDPPAATVHGWFADFISSHSPICFGGKLLGPWRDADGADRYACLYEPATASKETPLPLVVFMHGSILSADSIKITGLTSYVENTGRAPGFILLAPEGRYTAHYYPKADAQALGWDNWYRQLSPAGKVTVAGAVYPENADAAAIDHFIHEEVAAGKADSSRIYVMGWSNGAAMALLYALNRPWVAAAAVYSAPNPFGAFDDPCPQTPVVGAPSGNREIRIFNPHAPLMHVRNSCDIEGTCPNASAFADEMRVIGATLEDVIVDSSGQQVTACEAACGTDPMADGEIGLGGRFRGLMHHTFWPRSWTGRMLEFLKRHPLSQPATQV